MKAIFLSLAFLAATIFMSLVAIPGQVSAQFDPLQQSCEELRNPQRSDFCKEVATTEDPITGTEGIVLTVANLVALISGMIAVIILIIAGIQMVTSQGDSGKVKSSRDAIIYTVVGLVVLVLARSIVVFIINRVG